MRTRTSFVIASLLAAGSAHADDLRLFSDAELVPVTLVLETISSTSYGVTVYDARFYDGEADPPFILEFAREVPTRDAAKMYAEFRHQPGVTVVEYCRAVSAENGAYRLAQSLHERITAGCMVLGFESPKVKPWYDRSIPAKAKPTVQAKSHKKARPAPSKRRRQ